MLADEAILNLREGYYKERLKWARNDNAALD